MYRTFITLRLFVAGAALLLGVLAASVARAGAGSEASAHWLGTDGAPAAPDQCVTRVFTGPPWPPCCSEPTVSVTWHDNSDNEDGFTAEWWVKIKGEWVLREAHD